MCGREPNFQLPEEEKQELRRYKWDEFLAMTRRAITSKSNSLAFLDPYAPPPPGGTVTEPSKIKCCRKQKTAKWRSWTVLSPKLCLAT